jgi:hypothetical protein
VRTYNMRGRAGDAIARVRHPPSLHQATALVTVCARARDTPVTICTIYTLSTCGRYR